MLPSMKCVIHLHAEEQINQPFASRVDGYSVMTVMLWKTRSDETSQDTPSVALTDSECRAFGLGCIAAFLVKLFEFGRQKSEWKKL